MTIEHTHTHLQVSALELDIIEVDPETKEMLKTLVWRFTADNFILKDGVHVKKITMFA